MHEAYAPIVQARIRHANRAYDGKLLADDLKCLNALEERSVPVMNARAIAEPTLERNGLQLMRHSSAVGDFFNYEQMKAQYGREMEAFVGSAVGSNKVVIIDCVLRGSADLINGNPGTRIYEYAFKAHSDGDGDTFLAMAANIAPEETARYRNGRFAVYTVWRPLAPVEQKPLALCDGGSVSRDDLVAAYYSGYDDKAEMYPDLDFPPPSVYFHLAYSPDQRWFYFPDMTPDEVLIFKQWDSHPEGVLCVPHSAFEDPNTRLNPAPRTAIEARAVAFFPE